MQQRQQRARYRRPAAGILRVFALRVVKPELPHFGLVQGGPKRAPRGGNTKSPWRDGSPHSRTACKASSGQHLRAADFQGKQAKPNTLGFSGVRTARRFDLVDAIICGHPHDENKKGLGVH